MGPHNAVGREGGGGEEVTQVIAATGAEEKEAAVAKREVANFALLPRRC